MSYLLLVRHGQASFLEENYDKLSQKGERQARMLGEYWARHQFHFDHVYSGPRVRQQETARIAGEAMRAAGLNWPELNVLPEFDEFRAEAVVAQTLPALVESDPAVRALYQDFEKAEGQAARFKTFQRVFEVVVHRWAHGELPSPEIEPWSAFCDRIHSALAQLCGEPTSRRVVVFSSGGPTAVAMQRALDLSTENTLRTAWMVPNTAYSVFVFSRNRFTLSSYNSYPHITDSAFLTYR
jgi:broad specificity phosphatase PhoE